MSSSSSSRIVATVALALALALTLTGTGTGSGNAAADEQRVVVGVLPSEDAVVTADLLRGLRLALETSKAKVRVTLLVGKRGERWTTVASEAVRLATAEHALVLIAPPDRASAHLLAQVGTRCRVPIVSTSPAPSVTAAGSKWMISVVPRARTTPKRGAPPAPLFDATSREPGTVAFRKAFREHHRRDPRAWEAFGHDAARVVTEALRRGARTRTSLVRSIHGAEFVGATGRFRIDASGRRLPLRAGPR